MEWIADLHLHSKYSRAVSPQMELPTIARWAAIKGISLVGTGDWTHPLWLNELKSQLEEVNEGVFGLKKEMWEVGGGKWVSKWEVGSEVLEKVRFLLATEISSIYKQGGKQRRIHNLVFAPSFGVVEKINQALLARGCNLSSDGRPIIGLSAKDLAELVFSISEDCLLIPAHLWTPWFSLFGANSGFDSLKECFGEFSDKIYAIETGLSSDPAMNWRIKELDNRAIVSFSDAHSPRNLGREATVFEIKDSKTVPAGRQVLRYKDIKRAIVQSSIISHQSSNKISYTIEFFPEEGKYHYTGHRNCGVCQSPEETAKLGPICSVCGRKLTIGVMHRVQQLAAPRTPRKVPISSGPRGKLKKTENTEDLGVKAKLRLSPGGKRPPYVMLVPLREIIAESLGLGKGTKGVEKEYFKLISAFGSEFGVLLDAKNAKIVEIAGRRIAEGVKRVRDRELHIKAGFDGVFGKVKIWPSSATVLRQSEASRRREATEDKRKQLALF